MNSSIVSKIFGLSLLFLLAGCGIPKDPPVLYPPDFDEANAFSGSNTSGYHRVTPNIADGYRNDPSTFQGFELFYKIYSGTKTVNGVDEAKAINLENMTSNIREYKGFYRAVVTEPPNNDSVSGDLVTLSYPLLAVTNDADKENSTYRVEIRKSGGLLGYSYGVYNSDGGAIYGPLNLRRLFKDIDNGPDGDFIIRGFDDFHLTDSDLQQKTNITSSLSSTKSQFSTAGPQTIKIAFFIMAYGVSSNPSTGLGARVYSTPVFLGLQEEAVIINN